MVKMEGKFEARKGKGRLWKWVKDEYEKQSEFKVKKGLYMVKMKCKVS